MKILLIEVMYLLAGSKMFNTIADFLYSTTDGDWKQGRQSSYNLGKR
jgi:hypothetical protein